MEKLPLKHCLGFSRGLDKFLSCQDLIIEEVQGPLDPGVGLVPEVPVPLVLDAQGVAHLPVLALPDEFAQVAAGKRRRDHKIKTNMAQNKK